MNSSLTALLNAACPYIGLWLAMTMQSEKIPYDISNIIQHIPTSFNKVILYIYIYSTVIYNSEYEIEFNIHFYDSR